MVMTPCKSEVLPPDLEGQCRIPRTDSLSVHDCDANKVCNKVVPRSTSPTSVLQRWAACVHDHEKSDQPPPPHTVILEAS